MGKWKVVRKVPAERPEVDAITETFDFFFGLPRELRDEIYERGYITISCKNYADFCLETSTRSTDLRLVSKLCKAEYDDCAGHMRSVLTVSMLHYLDRGLYLPRKVSTQITHVHVRFRVRADWELNYHVKWFNRYIYRLPRLRSFVVELYKHGSIYKLLAGFIGRSGTVKDFDHKYGLLKFVDLACDTRSGVLLWERTHPNDAVHYDSYEV